MVDGCEVHGVSADAVHRRWAAVEALIATTAVDDHSAQWSVITVCACCCGTSKLPDLYCTRCRDDQ